MKEKKCSRRLIAYEFRNMNGMYYIHFFGILFPVFLSVILANTITGELTGELKREVVTSIVLTMSLVMPMSIMLIGYGAAYAQEVEKDIPLRMRLFGYKESTLVMAKIAAYLIFLTISFAIFGVAELLLLDIHKPVLSAVIILLICLYLCGIIFLVFAHAIGNIFRKFGVAYAINMGVYFMIMILCGMMGPRTSQLPEWMQAVARTLPMTYISNDFIGFWQGDAYNFMPLIQSFLFMGAVVAILLLYSNSRLRRR